MGRRKIKIQLSDFEAAGIHYIHFERVRNAKGDRGWRYVIEKDLTEAQKNFVLSFKNTILGTAQYRFAPEIIHDTVIVMDLCKGVRTCC